MFQQKKKGLRSRKERGLPAHRGCYRCLLASVFCPARTGCAEADKDLFGQRPHDTKEQVWYIWNQKVQFCC